MVPAVLVACVTVLCVVGVTTTDAAAAVSSVVVLVLLAFASVCLQIALAVRIRTVERKGNSRKNKILAGANANGIHKGDGEDEGDTILERRYKRKEEFLSRVGERDYGYASSPVGWIDEWRAHELPYLISPLPPQCRVESKKEHNPEDEQLVYLDYAGAALPTCSQLDQIYAQSRQMALANPHSSGPAANKSRLNVEQAKTAILEFFGAHPGRLAVGSTDEAGCNLAASLKEDLHPGYELVFTSGATEALRIVAERFPWSSASSGGCSCCCNDGTLALPASLLVYPQESHTSVVGMRAPALAQGAEFLCKPMHALLEDLRKTCPSTAMTRWRDQIHGEEETSCGHSDRGGCGPYPPAVGKENEQLQHDDIVHNLLVLPAECNFSGDRPKELASVISSLKTGSLDMSRHSRQDEPEFNTVERWFVMLDMAKAASTSPINLRRLDPDFACISFYKLFGEPTGLGCLFVKRSSIDVLIGATEKVPKGSRCRRSQQYFGGGSVDAILADADWTVPRSEPTPLASLHAGTSHFRGISLALQPGFAQLERLGGMPAIERHTSSLGRELARRLSLLRHENGRRAVVLYGSRKCTRDGNTRDDGKADLGSMFTAGPTVAFNIIRQDGSFVGYNEVSKLAALNSPPIQLRTGCFCNPGACQAALKLSNNDIVRNYTKAGHVCGDQIDIVNGKPTGAIRASFGKDSIWEDLDALVAFIERLYVSKSVMHRERTSSDTRRDGKRRAVVLSEMYIFPIKSCAAQPVRRWKIHVQSGKLALDREFAIVDSSGTAMRLSVYPKMTSISPVVDLRTRIMTVSAPGRDPLQINLDDTARERSTSIVKVCGNRCGAWLWGDYYVSEWFSELLNVRCWLARHLGGSYQLSMGPRMLHTIPRSLDVAFANEQPLLLISEHAVDTLNEALTEQRQRTVSTRHFRPNLVVRMRGQATERPHQEDDWISLTVLDKNLQLTVVGKCARCSMVDIDPTTGTKGNALRALADYRRSNGQIVFGIFLRGEGQENCNEGEGEQLWLEQGDILSCQ